MPIERVLIPVDRKPEVTGVRDFKESAKMPADKIRDMHLKACGLDVTIFEEREKAVRLTDACKMKYVL